MLFTGIYSPIPHLKGNHKIIQNKHTNEICDKIIPIQSDAPRRERLQW
jgi:hypothetical protein